MRLGTDETTRDLPGAIDGFSLDIRCPSTGYRSLLSLNQSIDNELGQQRHHYSHSHQWGEEHRLWGHDRCAEAERYRFCVLEPGDIHGQSGVRQHFCPIPDFDFVDRVERHCRNQRRRLLQCCCKSDIADKHSRRCYWPVRRHCHDERRSISTNFRDNRAKGAGVDNHRCRGELFGSGNWCRGNRGHSFERPTYPSRS